jgi:hypothetical protein
VRCPQTERARSRPNAPRSRWHGPKPSSRTWGRHRPPRTSAGSRRCIHRRRPTLTDWRHMRGDHRPTQPSLRMLLLLPCTSTLAVSHQYHGCFQVISALSYNPRAHSTDLRSCARVTTHVTIGDAGTRTFALSVLWCGIPILGWPWIWVFPGAAGMGETRKTMGDGHGRVSPRSL